MKGRICCALLAAAVTVGAAECSCPALEKEVRTLRAEMDDMKIEMRTLMGAGASERAPQHVAVEPVPGGHGRRLSVSNASTFVSVPARQVHEFVDGHSCPNIGGYMAALPVKTSGGVSWKPSPSDVIAEISLGAVNTDWSTQEIATSPSPLVLVHDDACALPPTLELRLNTSVHGSLTLNGHEVAAGPRDTQSYVASIDTPSPSLSLTGPQVNPLTFAAVTGMTKTVYLDASRTVLAWYSYGWLAPVGTTSADNGDWAVMDARMALDGVAEASTSSRTGAVHNREVAGTNVGLWMGTLTAGSHTFTVEARPWTGRTFTSNPPTEPGEERTLHVLVL